MSDDLSIKYLHLLEKIKDLEKEKADIFNLLKSQLPNNYSVLYNGFIYTWTQVTKKGSVSYKTLTDKAYSMLDDQGQVILQELKDSMLKPSISYRFEKEK